jgi:hypothetical protein
LWLGQNQFRGYRHHNLFKKMKKTAVILINLVVAIAAAQMPIRGSFKLIDPPEYSIDTMTVKLVGVDANGVSGILDYPTSQTDLQGVLDAGSTAEDHTITLTNSGSSLYSLTAYDRFQIGNFTIFRLGEIRHQNPSLNTHITLQFENPVDESVVTVPNQNGTMVLKNATNNIVELHDNTNLSTPQLTVRNISTGDAGIGFMAGTTGYTLGVDNSDGDKFVLSVAPGSIPNIGTNNRLVVESSGFQPFVIGGSGAGYYTSATWYTAITTNSIRIQSSNNNFSQLTNGSLIFQNGLENLTVNKTIGITSTIEESDIVLNLASGAKGTYLFPDLGDVDTEDVIVTQTTQQVQKATVTISPLELRECDIAPVVLIPAQGPGTIINVIGVTGYLDYNSAAYDFSDHVFTRTGNNPGWSVNQSEVNVIADNYFTFSPPTQSSSSTGNSPVVLTSGGGATAGNSPIQIIVTYTIDRYE